MSSGRCETLRGQLRYLLSNHSNLTITLCKLTQSAVIFLKKHLIVRRVRLDCEQCLRHIPVLDREDHQLTADPACFRSSE